MSLSFGTVLFTFISSLLMYAAFRPYTDVLLYRVVLSAVSLGALGGVFGPILRAQGPAMIPVYAVILAVAAAAWVTVFHFAERAVSRAA